MTARGFIIDKVNEIVLLPRPRPGKDTSLVASLTTVLESLPLHCFAKWDRTKLRTVVDQVGTSQAQAPPELECNWKRMMTSVQPVDLEPVQTDDGYYSEPTFGTEYGHQDNLLDEAFRGWRMYFGLPTSAARLAVGWAGSLSHHWQENCGFELGDSRWTRLFHYCKGLC